MRSAILRTLAYQASWQYAPTVLELQIFLDYSSKDTQNSFQRELKALIQDGVVTQEQGRVSLMEYQEQITNGKSKELFFWQKLTCTLYVIKEIR